MPCLLLDVNISQYPKNIIGSDSICPMLIKLKNKPICESGSRKYSTINLEIPYPVKKIPVNFLG